MDLRKHKVIGEMVETRLVSTIRQETISIVELPVITHTGYTHALIDEGGEVIAWLSPLKTKPGFYRLRAYKSNPLRKLALKGGIVELAKFQKQEPS